MVLEINDSNFETEVLKSGKPTLVDFWAPWCGPCQMMGPIIEGLSLEVGDKIRIGKVNVDESPQISRKYNIMSIPSLIIFKDGEVLKQLTPGVHSKESLLEEINNLK